MIWAKALQRFVLVVVDSVWGAISSLVTTLSWVKPGGIALQTCIPVLLFKWRFSVTELDFREVFLHNTSWVSSIQKAFLEVFHIFLKSYFEEFVLRGLNASPLIKPLVTPCGWHGVTLKAGIGESRNAGKWPQILKHATKENDPKS